MKNKISHIDHIYLQVDEIITPNVLLFRIKGLGLLIAKENTELIGDTITLKSKKGDGTTFYVTIPYKPVLKNFKKNN